MAHLIRKEQCPQCSKLGKDRSKDNLGVYSDGGVYCYSCGYTRHSNPLLSFRQPIREIHKPLVTLPEDATYDYPQQALNWIEQYELSYIDLLNNRAVYSPTFERLIFPIYGDNALLAYQGRYMGNKPRQVKWWGTGDLKNTFNILKGTTANENILILVEDIVSAIKLSRFTQAMPLYGAHISTERFKRLFLLLGKTCKVKIWLDYNKRKEAVSYARQANLYGLRATTIITIPDPKEIPYDQIKPILDSH